MSSSLRKRCLFNAVTATATSENLIEADFGRIGNTVVLQIEASEGATFSLDILGSVDSTLPTEKLSAVNMGDVSIVDTITAGGIYSLPVDGLAVLKLSLTSVSGGSVTAYGKLIDC